MLTSQQRRAQRSRLTISLFRVRNDRDQAA